MAWRRIDKKPKGFLLDSIHVRAVTHAVIAN